MGTTTISRDKKYEAKLRVIKARDPKFAALSDDDAARKVFYNAMDALVKDTDVEGD